MAIFTLIRLGFSIADMEGKTEEEIMQMAQIEEERAKLLQERQENP
jgi:hypothetical protein